MYTFEWVPSYSSRASRQLLISEVKFGDGYTQRTSDLINNNRLTFNLVFSKERNADLQAIDSFVLLHEGREPFIWNPPAPYNYHEAEQYLGLGYDSGSIVQSSDCVFMCVQSHELAKPLTNANYWKFICRLPLIFLCKAVDSSMEQYDANNLQLVFEQVFDPQ